MRVVNILNEEEIGAIITVRFWKMKGRTAGKGIAKKRIERPGLTEDEIEELREAFNLFDTEATGKIDPRYAFWN